MTVNAEIRSVIEHGDAIPSMPQIVTRLLEITGDKDYKVDDVISLLSTDAGIAADVLRLANSPLFGVTRKVASLTHATNLLGIKRIRTLVMGRCMVDSVNQRGTGLIDISYYWRRSLATGVLSARFAEHVVPKLREEAFMSGLLCDVGVAVLAKALPSQYGPIAKNYAPQKGADLIALERQTLGTTHPEVSAMVLERWSLPDCMIGAVRHHHDHEKTVESADGVVQLARIVDGSSDIARLLCEAPDQSIIAKTCVDAMAVVGLNINVLEHVLAAIEADVSELAAVLKIDVIPSRIYGLIAKTVADHLASPVA